MLRFSLITALFLVNVAPAVAGPLSLTIEGGPDSISGGDTALFDVYLRGLDGTGPGPVISFGLNVHASDDSLTAGGTDFSRFQFSLDSNLAGIIGGLYFDPDLSDDGRVEIAADIPPYNTETGIAADAGDVRLGTLSVLAPNVSGTYSVALAVDDVIPFLGSFLFIDDGSQLGLIAPGDLPLSVSGASFDVSATPSPVPEPSSLALIALGGLGLVGRRFHRRRNLWPSHVEPC